MFGDGTCRRARGDDGPCLWFLRLVWVRARSGGLALRWWRSRQPPRAFSILMFYCSTVRTAHWKGVEAAAKGKLLSQLSFPVYAGQVVFRATGGELGDMERGDRRRYSLVIIFVICFLACIMLVMLGAVHVCAPVAGGDSDTGGACSFSSLFCRSAHWKRVEAAAKGKLNMNSKLAEEHGKVAMEKVVKDGRNGRIVLFSSLVEKQLLGDERRLMVAKVIRVAKRFLSGAIDPADSRWCNAHTARDP